MAKFEYDRAEFIRVHGEIQEAIHDLAGDDVLERVDYLPGHIVVRLGTTLEKTFTWDDVDAYLNEKATKEAMEREALEAEERALYEKLKLKYDPPRWS